ncbi:hypothetical protein GDO81_001090 [Engystomops pustulosus]|uniref:Taste receptor type 2 n=1 Tax=Engystomops pustulosus TaxID=76066 RepID=A0AAV7DAH1_ENGPU|nr:hypothetical protein GDO81_001090 [Engystomops pustulosus]
MDAVIFILIYIHFVTIIISFSGNIFIVSVNLLDFYKNRRLPISDQLILGFSVFSLLYGLNEGYILIIDLTQFYSSEYFNIEKHFFMYVNSCTLWFPSLLSLHFCLKIVNINNRFYVGLQRRFPTLFPWVIIASPIGYFFLGLYSVLWRERECLQNTTSQNLSAEESTRCSWSLFIFTITCVLCTFFCSVSALTIASSLLKHMRRVQQNTEGSRSPNMDSHIRAIKTIGTLLATNILIFISVSILVLDKTAVPWRYLLGILISFCHILSSYFLIKGTKKLDKTLAEILNMFSWIRGNNQ